MVQINTNPSSFQARHTVAAPHQKGSTVFGRQLVGSQDKKWGAEQPQVRRDQEDRSNLRLSGLERRMDSLEKTMKIGAFVIVAVGVSCATYQNWVEIQGAANSAWAKIPTVDEIKTGAGLRWQEFTALFSRT